MSLIKYLSLSVFCASLAGCASYNTETHQKVKFISEDTPSVTVIVDGEVVGTTDCRAVISRSSNHDVLFSKPGYKSAKYSLVPFEDPDTGVVGFLDSVYVPELAPEDRVAIAFIPSPTPPAPVDVPAPTTGDTEPSDADNQDDTSGLDSNDGADSSDGADVPAPTTGDSEPSDADNQDDTSGLDSDDGADSGDGADVPAPTTGDSEPSDADNQDDTSGLDSDDGADSGDGADVPAPTTGDSEPSGPDDPINESDLGANDEPKADEPAPVVRGRTLKELRADLSELKRQRKLNLISEEEFNKRLAELSDEVSKTY